MLPARVRVEWGMYVPAHFAWSGAAALHAWLRTHPFATIAGVIDGEIHFAYVPLIMDSEPAPLGAVRFHVARANPLARLEDGALVKFSVLGPHAYISPDWYEADGQVPTWNYVAVEGRGRAKRVGAVETRAHLEALAAQEEAALAPKPAWRIARVPEERLVKMLPQIVGFHLVLDSLEGKVKLSQNKSAADRTRVIAALETRGDAESAGVAQAMRKEMEHAQ
jgi:transcriptional regulator